MSATYVLLAFVVGWALGWFFGGLAMRSDIKRGAVKIDYDGRAH